MVHEDHVRLIEKAITRHKGVWADFGSGDGAFTLALRDLAGPSVEIYSIDKDAARLKTQARTFEEMFEKSTVHFFNKDFTQSVDLPLLDGIMMANSLHYVKDQISFLLFIKKYLKPQGKLVLVEYNADTGNMWVPYPVSFVRFCELCKETGFQPPKLLSTISSRFLNEIYSSETRLS